MHELVIGYRFVGKGKYQAIPDLKPGMIYSAAVITCARCGTVIAGMGGPRSGCYCPSCFDVIKMEAFARGTLLEEQVNEDL